MKSVKLFSGPAIWDDGAGYVTVTASGDAFTIVDGAGRVVRLLESGAFTVDRSYFVLTAEDFNLKSKFRVLPMRTMTGQTVTFPNEKKVEAVTVSLFSGWVEMVWAVGAERITGGSVVSRNGQIVLNRDNDIWIIDTPAGKKKGCGCGKQ